MTTVRKKGLDIFEKILFHAFTLIVIAWSLYMSLTSFPNTAIRTVQALKDLWLSLKYYGLGWVNMHGSVKTTVQTMPAGMELMIPITWADLKALLLEFGQTLINVDHIASYMSIVLNVLYYVSMGITFCAIPFALVILLTWLMYIVVDNEHGKQSVPMKIWYRLEDIFYYPAKHFVCRYIRFILDTDKKEQGEKTRRIYLWLICPIWTYNLNGFTIAIEVLAWLFFFPFAEGKRIESIPIQIAKLLVDLTVAIDFLPVWALIGIGYLLFDIHRKNVGYARLEDGEEENRRFLLANPGNLLATGPPRVGKTQGITDMGISQQIVFRKTAQQKSLEHHMEFPFFKWGLLEQTLINMRQKVPGFSLTFIRHLIPTLQYMFESRAVLAPSQIENAKKRLKNWGYQGKDFIFDYDYQKYGMEYDNGLVIVSIWKAIRLYAEEFYIYTQPTPLIFGNYPVQTDVAWKDFGNYPIMDAELFKRTPRERAKLAQFSHVVTHDAMRLGKKKNPDGIYNNSYDSGVFLFSEAGKELGNQITNRGKDKDKDSEKSNPNNDLWTMNAKMISHGTTIDYFTYFRILADEQRAMSILADFRELGDELQILSKSPEKIKMPHFAFGELFYLIAKKIMTRLMLFFKSKHGKMTLCFYLCLRVYSLIFNHYQRIYNTFAVSTQKIKVKNDVTGEKAKIWTYNLARKKICGDAYNTIFFFPYYDARWSKSTVGGLNATPQFKSLDATFEEMRFMASNFNEAVFEHFELTDTV